LLEKKTISTLPYEIFGNSDIKFIIKILR
jgi:hypothetical protein